jgi:hypothetical protein
MRRLLVLLLVLLACPRVFAGIADAPPDVLQVSLLTYGPGDIYWERFGHDAIELRDPASGEAIAFNYGVFDFEQEGFLLNFARGIMAYRMDAEPTSSDVAFYRGEGRQVTRQQLALTPAQVADLRRFLFWNMQPENMGYNYNYYVDNCATRVRDALDRVLGGQLQARLAAEKGGMTYRQQTARLMSNQAWLMIGMDMGLGPYADQPMDAWKSSFLPMVLQDEVARMAIGGVPLVARTDIVAAATIDQPPVAAPGLFWPLFVAGLVLAGLLVLLARVRVARGLLGTLWLLFAGLAGLAMAGLWAFTLHRSAWANANLLLLNPLAFGLLPAMWRGFGPRSRWLAWGLLGMAVAALLLHLVPGFIQQNQPWIGLALPVWVAVVFVAHRQRRA